MVFIEASVVFFASLENSDCLGKHNNLDFEAGLFAEFSHAVALALALICQ